jgi:hypothetical protein
MRCPAIRPATRTLMPRARPMIRGSIPFMMVAVAYGAYLDSITGTAAGTAAGFGGSSGLLSDLNGSKVKRFRFAVRIPILAGRSCSRSWR